MCDEAVDNLLAALKFIPYWFVTSKMLEKLGNALYTKMIYSFTIKILIIIKIIANQKHILAVDLEKVNLDNNFSEDDPDTIIHIRFLAWRSKSKKLKAPEKDK